MRPKNQVSIHSCAMVLLQITCTQLLHFVCLSSRSFICYRHEKASSIKSVSHSALDRVPEVMIAVGTTGTSKQIICICFLYIGLNSIQINVQTSKMFHIKKRL